MLELEGLVTCCLSLAPWCFGCAVSGSCARVSTWKAAAGGSNRFQEPSGIHLHLSIRTKYLFIHLASTSSTCRFVWHTPERTSSLHATLLLEGSTALVAGALNQCGSHKTIKARFQPQDNPGTQKAVEARFWPWLSGKSPQNTSSCSLFEQATLLQGDNTPQADRHI